MCTEAVMALCLIHILLAPILQHTEPASNLPVPAFLRWGWGCLPCKVHFAWWCSRQPSINDGGEFVHKYPSSLDGAGVTLGHVFSSDSQSFLCGTELQLLIVVTTSQSLPSCLYLSSPVLCCCFLLCPNELPLFESLSQSLLLGKERKTEANQKKKKRPTY